MLRPYIANENNPHMHPAGEEWRGEKLYDFRFYELEIVSYSLPLAVFRWDTYARNDSFHRHCDFYELVLVYRGFAVSRPAGDRDGERHADARGVPPGT